MLVFAAMDGYGTISSGGGPGGSPTAILVGAAAGSGSASVLNPGTDGATSAVPTIAGASGASGASGAGSTPAGPTNPSTTPGPAGGTPTNNPATNTPATNTPAANTPAANTPAAATPAPIDTSDPVDTPDPAAPALDITSLPASVAANESVTLTAVTAPNASCKVKAKFSGGKASLAPGLSKKQTADTAGSVSWTWIVDSDAQPGTGTVTVSCNSNGHGVSKSKVFVVV
jgi:hypothetical protein